MLKHKLIATIGLTLTLVAHGAAQFDMNSWFSSPEYEDSLESASYSEEYENLQEIPKRTGRNVDEPPPTSTTQKPTLSSIKCNLELLPQSNYKPQDRVRYEAIYCQKCRRVTLLPGQKIDNQGKSNLKYIMFENSILRTIPENVFIAFTNFTLLSSLYLNDSSVNTIQPGAFMGLNGLEELYLQNNNLIELLKSTFTYLGHVKLLNLAYSNVKIVHLNAFDNLLSLRILYLNNNKIDVLLEETFHSLKFLRFLDLSNNRLLDVSDLLFYSVGTFNLKNNNLTAFDFSTLPTYLEEIFLDNNKINYIENLKKIQNVATLSLSNNNISNIGDLPGGIARANFSRNNIRELPTTIFNRALYLAILDFSYNLIENLSQDHFGRIGNLKEIYFQNNRLITVPDGCFRNLYLLKILNLSNNLIIDFKFGTFSGLISLEYLDISNNKANFLYENSFYGLRNLKVLNIAGNVLNSLDPNDLLNNLRKLTVVTLDNNPWVCKYLSSVVTVLGKADVNITKGSTVIGRNVNGIGCSDQVPTTVAPTIRSINSNAALDRLQKISDELKVMRDFFDQDFVYTNFYKYFESFKNIKASENFDSKYISNVLVNHIDDSFKNTTFYKFLSNSNLIESLSNISKALRSFDIRFENPEPQLATSSKYTNKVDYLKNQDIILKISDLQTGITAVIVIVIIILLSIIILFIIQKISNPVKLFHKSVFRKRTSSAEIELI